MCIILYYVSPCALVGVGRIIAEAKSIPTIIPFYHVGKLACTVAKIVDYE